jgi:hypothetical protein
VKLLNFPLGDRQPLELDGAEPSAAELADSDTIVRCHSELVDLVGILGEQIVDSVGSSHAQRAAAARFNDAIFQTRVVCAANALQSSGVPAEVVAMLGDYSLEVLRDLVEMELQTRERRRQRAEDGE